MRGGDGRTQWVRPIRAITATFGGENEETEVIDFSVEGMASGRTTYGHRFMAPGPIEVRHFSDYASALEKAKVIVDLDRRRDIIKTDAEQLAFARGLTLITDDNLLEEVAGLVEWPVVMMGSFEERFLAVPEEVCVLASRHSLSLARWTGQSAWLDYVVELHLAARRAMSSETASSFESVLSSSAVRS